MKTRLIPPALLVSAALLFSADAAFAQCAMCKAIAGSNAETADNVVQGLNAGILYLMVMPYIALAVLGVVLYRKKLFSRFGKSPGN